MDGLDLSDYDEYKPVGLGIDVRTQHPLVILYCQQREVMMPIWIGHVEAQSIAIAMQGEHLERPMTHDLLLECIEQTDRYVMCSRVHSVRGGTFFAELVLQTRDREDLTLLDARPSDCIALCIRAVAPVYIARSVTELSAIPAVIESRRASHSDSELDKAEFMKFLDTVKASDFRLPADTTDTN